jgi:hypothetical protein
VLPTLGEWALNAMALLLGGTGFVALRRRTA